MELIKEFGLIAGLAGLGIGVFLMLFRNLISKTVLDKLSEPKAYNVIVLFMVLVWSIAGFCIYQWSLNGAKEKDPIKTFQCPKLNKNVGEKCNDHNSKTINDTVLSDCSCKGTFQGSEYQCKILKKNIGDSCNDTNPNTKNDTVNSNCKCVGTKIYPTKIFKDTEWMLSDLSKKSSPGSYLNYHGRYFYKPYIRHNICPTGWRLPLASEYFTIFNNNSKENLSVLNFHKPGRLSENKKLSNHIQYTYLVEEGIVSFNKNSIAESVTSGGIFYYPCRCVKK